MESQNSFRSSTFHIVLEEYDKLNDKHITELSLNEYLKNELRIQFYAFIKHDMDKDIVGEQLRVHYHIVIKCNQPYSKNTIICSISREMNINRDCIGVRKVQSFVLMCQYLLHKNDKDKYQYDYMDIWTNDVNELNKAVYLGVSDYDTDIDYLIAMVEKHDTLTELYKDLGLKKSKQYRSLIMDLWKEKNLLW